MNILTGRPDHIEDWLVKQHTGCWFDWTDTENKIYANLTVSEGYTKPTEAECNQGLTDLQAEFDANEYKTNRRFEYPSIGDQLDALFHAGVFPDDMAAQIQAVKDKYPKE